MLGVSSRRGVGDRGPEPAGWCPGGRSHAGDANVTMTHAHPGALPMEHSLSLPGLECDGECVRVGRL